MFTEHVLCTRHCAKGFTSIILFNSNNWPYKVRYLHLTVASQDK